MKEKQNSELPKVKKTAAPEPKKTTPPTSQTKLNTQKSKVSNTSLPSQNTTNSTAKKPTPRKRVRPLQTIGQSLMEVVKIHHRVTRPAV